MAFRTTVGRVQAVLGGEWDGETDLTPFLRPANIMLTRALLLGAANGKRLSVDEAAEVETWLAAHMYQQMDRGYTSRSTDGASGSFMGQGGMGLDSTLYGQTAKRLDWT